MLLFMLSIPNVCGVEIIDNGIFLSSVCTCVCACMCVCVYAHTHTITWVIRMLLCPRIVTVTYLTII